MTVPFDRITLDADGKRLSMSFDVFSKLPLHQRVQYLMNRSAEFFEGETRLDRRVVLRALMKS